MPSIMISRLARAAAVLAAVFAALPAFAQSPGMVISEYLANPSGTDSPFEYVELVATRTIDFTVTPYTVVFSNNGTATANGWRAGAGLTYAFAITSGSVVAGDVVYVGGSSMVPTGTKLRTINTGTTAGDGTIGNANATGVLGNGGGNADSIGLFDVAVASLTSSTVPVDAIFYGTGTGTAVVTGGSAGYELPVNDRYSGGKLQTTSFIALEPANGTPTHATGALNVASGSWPTVRTWATAAATAGTTITLISPPNLTINDVTQSEGNGGTTTYTFTVSLDAPAPTGGVTFDIATADDSALASSDYIAKSLPSQTIPMNSSTYTFDVLVNGDTMFEQNEDFLVNVSNIIGATPSSAQGQGSIQNDDSEPTLSIGNASLMEGSSGTTNAQFNVDLNAASSLTVTVDYATADGTATVADNDFVATAGTLSFSPGQTHQTILVPVNGDMTYEPDETFFVNLSNPSQASLSDAQGVGQIWNDDDAADVSTQLVATPDSGFPGDTVTFTMTVTNSGPSTAYTPFFYLQLPTGLQFQSLNGGGLMCSAPPIGNSGTITCFTVFNSLPVGTTSILATATIAPSAAPDSVLTASATVTSTTIDPNPANNTSPAAITVLGRVIPATPVPTLDPRMLALLALLVLGIAAKSLRHAG
ncbi:MAG TPA: Calx-beta domain-containing protein [Pseudomonadota bacterium]|nr:hypothetical protein [Rhodanobacteraceae bacterium]MBP9154862.1 hypothetical protein [Xanthomonadales bacterium]HQW81448.1 Calx-beta domain-containing protein [Pseudomonadota bacterium]